MAWFQRPSTPNFSFNVLKSTNQFPIFFLKGFNHPSSSINTLLHHDMEGSQYRAMVRTLDYKWKDLFLLPENPPGLWSHAHDCGPAAELFWDSDSAAKLVQEHLLHLPFWFVNIKWAKLLFLYDFACRECIQHAIWLISPTDIHGLTSRIVRAKPIGWITPTLIYGGGREWHTVFLRYKSPRKNEDSKCSWYKNTTLLYSKDLNLEKKVQLYTKDSHSRRYFSSFPFPN